MRERYTSYINANYTFETFQVSDSNREACNAALRMAQGSKSAGNPLVIYGESFAGKTHLLDAIGNYIQKEEKDINVAYITAEDFETVMLESTYDGGKELVLPYDVILFDNIEQFKNKPTTLGFFAETVKKCCDGGKRVAVSLNCADSDIRGAFKAICRIRGARVISIQERGKIKMEWFEVDKRAIKRENYFACPVCGKKTLPLRGYYLICKECGWEDEEMIDENESSGANADYNIKEYREQYLALKSKNPKYSWYKANVPMLSRAWCAIIDAVSCVIRRK